jgi:hypothetical protein
MKRRPGNDLAMPIIFRILIVRSRMTGNTQPVRVSCDLNSTHRIIFCSNYLSQKYFRSIILYTGKNLFRRTHRWDINTFTDILLLICSFM